jgi:predicted permease
MNWFQRLTRSGRMEKELDTELRFHFESQVADKIHAGMSEAEARRTTRLEFGGLDQIKEDCRESRGTLWLTSIMQDLRFGIRILVRSPAFSFTAILVLALGIGVSTLAFSLYNLIALQSIPVRDPATLIGIQRRSPENIVPGVPYASIAYYRDNAKSLSVVMATMSAGPMVLDHDDQTINPSFVTSNYFTELGASAVAGRLFDPVREDSSGATPVVVLSSRFWQRKFGNDPSIIGKTLYLAGKPVTVIGVTSQRFASLGPENPDVWLPLLQHPYFFEGSRPMSDPKFDGMIIMWGRLAPGFTPLKAEQELLSLTNQLRKLYPAVIWDHERIIVSPAAHFFPPDEDGAPILALVALLVLLILAVACANLGGLLMARGVIRQREIQLRLDLGARKSRLFRQLLTESLLLGLLGSIAALPLSYIVLRLALVYANAPTWMSALPDWRVLIFTAAMGFLAAIFFGMLPTLQMVQRKKQKTLWHQFVVCAQVGASCVLLILAGLLVRATLHTIYTDPGFGYEQVLSLDPGLSDHGYTSAAAQNYLDQLQARLRSVPGVISVSIAQNPPLINTVVMIKGFNIDGHHITTYPNWVGPEFFQTMGIPLLRGRYMRAGETHVVMLSESLARKRWPTEDPIGKEWVTGKDIVVGIVGNTRAMELNNSDATEIYYPPSAESLPNMSVLIRTAGAPDDLSPTLKQIAGSIDPKLFPALTPLKAGFVKSIGQVEQVATIISLLGSIAIFLAVVGLLGLITYAVSQRTKEIAIRLALGASRTEIFSAVLRRFAWPVLIGLLAGVAITAGLSQILRRGLYGISGLDPISYVGAMTLLIAVLTTAALLPIRRAFRINIARILHSD